MIYWLCIDWKLSIKWCAAVFFNVMWSSSLCNSKVCPLQYLTRHVKASCSDFNYASCIAPVILIGHSVESVSSYVNCSIMLRIPHVHHPYAFLSREFMNYVIGSVWKRCKFVFFLLVWELLGVNSFTPIHFSPPPPPRLSQTPASAYSPTPTQKHTHSKGCKQSQRSEGQWRHRRNGGVKLWVTLHLQSLCFMLLLRTWWGHLTVWCWWQRYREHHTLQFWSGLIVDPLPRSPANLHPVTCRGKGQSR